MPWLINASQLDKFRKNQKNVVVLDATWFLPGEQRDARHEFNQEHIAGARFLDLNEFHDDSSSLPNMLSDNANAIAEKLTALGVTNEQKIIFYDRSPLHTSCRALWMFKVFGHNPFQLYILDGGHEAWKKFGGKIDVGDAKSTSGKGYSVNFQRQYMRDLTQMKHNYHHPAEQVIDLRHPVRYAGGADPRPQVRSGHIPGSFCYPYSSIFEADGRFKSLEKIRKNLVGMGIEFQYPIVSTCGSGMTAPILNFVLDLMDQTQHAVYDGSWSEWGANALYPGEVSLDERPVKTSLEN